MNPADHSQPDAAKDRPPPSCPRCDYDLAGEVATWTQQCPLTSRCPECGLDVRWTSVYRAVTPPPWSVEHAEPRAVNVLRAALRSAAVAFIPGVLWQRLTLGMRVEPRRLVLMLVLWCVVGYLLAVGMMIGFEYLAHLADYHAYAEMVASSGGAWGTPQYTPFSVTAEPLRTLFPFFRIGGGSGITPQPALLALLFVLSVPGALVLLPFSLRHAKVSPRHLVRLVAYWSVWILPALVFPAWTYALIRTVESLGVLSRYRLGRSNPSVAITIAQSINALESHSTLLATGIVFLLIAWFWRQACRHYLRLPRPGLVAVGITTLSLLLTAAVGFFLIPGADDFVTRIIYEAIGK
jgi:hypothetical protein